jgi:hypothetical protein
MFLDIINAKGETEQDHINIEEALSKAWDALPDSLFESLIESMPRRIEAYIKANGWHIKYWEQGGIFWIGGLIALYFTIILIYFLWQ